jgi:hypothetical protein
MKKTKLPYLLILFLSFVFIGIVYSAESGKITNIEKLINQNKRAEEIEEKIDILIIKTQKEKRKEIQEKLLEILDRIEIIKKKIKTEIIESIKENINSEEYIQKQTEVLTKAISENSSIVCHTTSFPLGLHHIYIKPEKIKIVASIDGQVGETLLKDGITYVWNNDTKEGFYSIEEISFSSATRDISYTIINDGNPFYCSEEEIDDGVFEIPDTIHFIEKNL